MIVVLVVVGVALGVGLIALCASIAPELAAAYLKLRGYMELIRDDNGVTAYTYALQALEETK